MGGRLPARLRRPSSSDQAPLRAAIGRRRQLIDVLDRAPARDLGADLDQPEALQSSEVVGHRAQRLVEMRGSRPLGAAAAGSRPSSDGSSPSPSQDPRRAPRSPQRSTRATARDHDLARSAPRLRPWLSAGYAGAQADPTAADATMRPLTYRGFRTTLDRPLERGVLREHCGTNGRRDRAPPARDRAFGSVPLARRQRLRLRSDTRRPRAQQAGGLTEREPRCRIWLFRAPLHVPWVR